MTERATLHLRITGRVQGVFYRESMRIEAERLAVTGWVRNRSDGSVEAVVHGSTQALNAITHWARRGPADAAVSAVEISAAEGEFDRFEKLSTL